MQDLVIDNKAEIRWQLQRLGFSNADEILDTAIPLYAVGNSSPSGVQLVDLEANTGSKQSGFVFSLGGIHDDTTWEIKSVAYSTRDQSHLSPAGGGMPFARYWHAGDGPLPHKERMRWEVKRGARIEAEKEYFYSNPSAIKMAPADKIDKITPLNKAMEIELTRLGYPHYPQMTQTATFYENLAFVKSQEKIDPKVFPRLDVINFFFAVVYPENRIPLRIEYINASLAPAGPPNRALRVLTEKAYWLSNGVLPSKDHVIGDIAKRLNPALKAPGRASMLTADFKNRSPGGGLRH